MAWFSNGKKYWKHNGRIYSSRIKRRSSSGGFGFFQKAIELVPSTNPKKFKKINYLYYDDHSSLILEEKNNKYYLTDHNSHRSRGEEDIITEISESEAKEYIKKYKNVKNGLL